MKPSITSLQTGNLMPSFASEQKALYTRMMVVQFSRGNPFFCNRMRMAASMPSTVTPSIFGESTSAGNDLRLLHLRWKCVLVVVGEHY